MARWCEELLGKEAIVGDGSVVMLLAETRLRFPLNARELVADELHTATVLVGLTESTEERATLVSLARTLTVGRSEVRLVSEHDWVASVVQELLSRPEVECNLIFASRTAPPGFVSQIGLLMSQIQAAGVNVQISTLVTEQADPTLTISGLHGLISAQADWLQTAITVFHILSSLMAPVQYTCLDMVDLRAMFEIGKVTRVIEVMSTRSGVLLFPSEDDAALFRTAESYALFVCGNKNVGLGEVWSALWKIREIADPAAGFVVSYAYECVNHIWQPTSMVRLTIVCRLRKGDIPKGTLALAPRSPVAKYLGSRGLHA